MKQLFTRVFSSLQKLLRGVEAPGAMKCIVGLGNPGEEYRATRHNAGIRVIESLVQLSAAKLHRGNGDFFFAECADRGDRFLAIAPVTFMNESGRAMKQAMLQFRLSPSDFIIVYDDFQLPLGTLRIREDGGDGGHNGLASIINELQTEHIPRLRVGIAGTSRPTENKGELMATYVLSPFETEEAKIAEHMINHARDAILAWVHHGIRYSMNNFNKSFL